MLSMLKPKVGFTDMVKQLFDIPQAGKVKEIIKVMIKFTSDF